MLSNTIVEVDNAMDLSTHYLNRFFSHAGPIKNLFKDHQNKVIVIEFKQQSSAAKALTYSNRVLDKKPITVKYRNMVREVETPNHDIVDSPSIHSNKHKYERQRQRQQTHIKITTVPYLEQPKSSNYKIQIQSSYRVIEHDDVEDHVIHFKNNPLQGLKNKGDLWKAILYEITHHIKKFQPDIKELILSATLGIWALTQIKLRQVKYYINHNENQITKYFDNFMQEIVVNKLCLIKNQNLINKGHLYKTQFFDQIIKLEFKIPYPNQLQEQSKHLCISNKQMHSFLYYVYNFSQILGKIYHNLYANSLIAFESEQLVQLTRIFNDEIFQQNQKQMSQHTYMSSEDQWARFTNKQTQNSFIGEMDNIGNYIFEQFKPHWQSNSVVWLEIQNKKLNDKFPYPGFFYCSLRMSDGCYGRKLEQKSFLNLYEITNANLFDKEQETKLEHVTQLTLGQEVIVFEECQFSIDQVVDFSIKCLRFIKKNRQASKDLVYAELVEKQQIVRHNSDNKKQKHTLTRSVVKDKKQHQQDQANVYSRDQESYNQGQQSVQLSVHKQDIGSKISQENKTLSLHVIYMLNNYKSVKEKEHQFLKAEKILNNPKYWCKIFNQQPEHRVYAIKIKFSIIALIPAKVLDFNTFKCEAYLINYLDHYVYGKNSIISSKQFAEVLAEKVLSQCSGKKLFGFNDKKYIGAELWRLYQKCGQRRIKQKIEEEYSKHGSKKIKN